MKIYNTSFITRKFLESNIESYSENIFKIRDWSS